MRRTKNLSRQRSVVRLGSESFIAKRVTPDPSAYAQDTQGVKRDEEEYRTDDY